MGRHVTEAEGHQGVARVLPLFDRRHHARTVQAGAKIPMHGGADAGR